MLRVVEHRPRGHAPRVLVLLHHRVLLVLVLHVLRRIHHHRVLSRTKRREHNSTSRCLVLMLWVRDHERRGAHHGVRRDVVGMMRLVMEPNSTARPHSGRHCRCSSDRRRWRRRRWWGIGDSIHDSRQVCERRR
jgi:hypothetical protein